MSDDRLRVVLVTGLSGSGKSSVLRALEDLGYEAVDNPPLPMIEEMVTRSERPLAVGVDARTRGFEPYLVLRTLERLRDNPSLRPELAYVWADETTLLRRYTETRRRHPLAPQGRVARGIAREEILTAPLRHGADLVIDSSGLPLASLRRLVEQRFGSDQEGVVGLVVSLLSFAYKLGLPREADLVFDARFLRNPYYDPILQARTGLDPEVGAFIAADPDFAKFFTKMAELIDMLLPRFVQEGKKYATITIGCTGGRHRSVYLVEKLANHLTTRLAAAKTAGDAAPVWRLHVTHRELGREDLDAAGVAARSASGADDVTNIADAPAIIQAQEA